MPPRRQLLPSACELVSLSKFLSPVVESRPPEARAHTGGLRAEVSTFVRVRFRARRFSAHSATPTLTSRSGGYRLRGNFLRMEHGCIWSKALPHDLSGVNEKMKASLNVPDV
jgi:hypothetical protein